MGTPTLNGKQWQLSLQRGRNSSKLVQPSPLKCGSRVIRPEIRFFIGELDRSMSKGLKGFPVLRIYLAVPEKAVRKDMLKQLSL